MKKEMIMYYGKVYGVEVSKYGKENGYLDYRTLARILDNCIANNDVYDYWGIDELDIINGSFEDHKDVSQYFIISKYGAEILKEYTNQPVYYHYDTNLYIWGVPYFGTSWDYVLTDIRLVDGDK